MKWITALQLQQWAEGVSARTVFPELIGDLVRASSMSLRAFRFPSGAKGQVRGFDGYLDADAAPPFVPEGTSIWEFGVTPGAKGKFLSDLKTRSAALTSDQLTETTFVFVTPQTYDNPEKLLPELVAEQSSYGWKDILYIDGSQLEVWLSACPAVAARYARFELQLSPQWGARSLDEFWDEYSNRFAPQLIEEVLLSGRQSEAEEVVRQLTGEPGSIRIAADSPDEALAFAVAAVRKSDPAVRLFIESRALVVDSDEAGRQLFDRSNHIFLPRADATAVSGALASRGATLLAIGRDQVNGEYKYLPKPSYNELAKSLEGMGYDSDAALEVSRSCGRSITILARQIPGGNVSSPPWIQHASTLVPAILAGGWDVTNNHDVAAIGALTGTSYREFERKLRDYASTQDPPLDLEGSIWKVRAPVDAFNHVGRWVDGGNLDNLASVASDMFSQVLGKPDENDRYGASPGRSHTHSSWLRDGIATSILQIAVLSKQALVNVPGIVLERWVEDLISSLPGLRDNARLIASLRSELPLLMEAAPGPLLAALEQVLEGEEAKDEIFWDHDPLFGPTSPHVYILWALERLVWDPRLLGRASLIIARLADLQSEASSGNSPSASLRSIFLPWSPNTYANHDQRLAAIDAIVAKFPVVGWNLLIGLLPKPHDVSVPTTKPKYREASASTAEILTYRIVWDAQAAIIDRVLTQSKNDGSRVLDLVSQFYNWEDEDIDRALVVIDEYFDYPDRYRLDVWNALRDLSNKHKSFSDTDWALKGAWIARIDSIVVAREPTDPFEKIGWLFDDYWLEMPGDFEEHEKSANEARKDAVRALMSSGGDEAVLRLVNRAKYTDLVATALGDGLLLALDEFESYLLAGIKLNNEKGLMFVQMLSALAHGRFQDAWQSRLASVIQDRELPEEIASRLLVSWRDEPRTWDFAETLGPAVNELYWAHKRAFSFDGSQSDLIRGVREYMRVGRPDAALSFSYKRYEEIGPELLVAMLNDLIPVVNSERGSDNMTIHLATQAIQKLRSMEGISEEDVARVEYAYLPALRSRDRPLVIHKLLASNPAFYVSLLEAVFRAEGEAREEEEQIDKARQAKWRADYRLLSDFATLPGLSSDGVSYPVLIEWIEAVRALAAKGGRAVIADQYVGHLLAHAPNSQGEAWPPEAVAKIIEYVASAELERGFQIECHNKRGVYSKSLFEGGKQERALAEQYRMWGRMMAPYPRTANLLQAIAESWDRDAEREDLRARQDMLKH